MSLAAHIKHLEDKKQQLETEIHAESLRPAPNYMVIRDLKKKKLLVKEKIFNMTHAGELHWASA